MILSEIFSFNTAEPPQAGEEWEHVDSPLVKANVLEFDGKNVLFQLTTNGVKAEPKTMSLKSFLNVWKRQ